MHEATIALSQSTVLGLRRGTEPMEVFREALLHVGARPADLDLYHQARTRDPHWAQTSREPSTEALVSTLADYAMTGIDTTDLSLQDAIAWTVVTQGEPEDLTTLATWMGSTPHGWLLHAAGLALAEAIEMEPVGVDLLYAMAALRGSLVPSWPPGQALLWPAP